MAVWTLGCIVLDDSCKSGSHLASESKNDFHKTLSGRNHGVPFCALSSRSFVQFLLPFPSAILMLIAFIITRRNNVVIAFGTLSSFVCISAQTLPPATTCPYYSLYQVWQPWAYSLVFVQLACWHTGVSRWSGGQPWRLSPFHRRKHCWCAHTSFRHFQCSHCVVLVPFCIIRSLRLIAVWFLQAIWLPE